MIEMDTQLVCAKFQDLIYKMERYLNIFHIHVYSFFFPLVYMHWNRKLMQNM